MLKDTADLRDHAARRPSAWPSNRLVLGKHSGRHAFADRLKELGVDFENPTSASAFTRFKALADKKKNIYDEDLLALVADPGARAASRYELLDLSVTSSSSRGAPQAEVRMRVDGAERAECRRAATAWSIACFNRPSPASSGDSPRLERYQVSAITRRHRCARRSCPARCATISSR